MELDATAKRALGRYSKPYLARWVIQRAIRGLTAGLRTLPDFVIIGAQRCGTTSLYNYLGAHPQIASSFMKETHFFDLHYRRGLNWYRSQFPLASQVRRRHLVVGEATPYYLFYPHAPRRAYAVLPDARLIVLLRNPVDRAYSHYHHEISSGVETATFEEALSREEEVLPAETTRLLQDESHRSFAHFHYSYLARGIYVDQLERWAQSYGPNQMLVLNSEYLFQDPGKAVARVLDWLGLPGRAPGRYEIFNLAHYADMEPATRERLVAYYRPHNQRLYAFLGQDFGWET